MSSSQDSLQYNQDFQKFTAVNFGNIFPLSFSYTICRSFIGVPKTCSIFVNVHWWM